MKTKDILLLGGIALGGYFLFFTDEGSELVNSITGTISDTVGDIGGDLGIDYIGGGYKGKRGPRKRGTISDINDEYYFPIQDLFIPENYYRFRYVIDPHRIPSEDFWDWYRKGSGIIYEDYYYPPHSYWNPDYYFYWGNMYKRWYPNLSELPGRPIRQ